jgi:hypothetical protein
MQGYIKVKVGRKWHLCRKQIGTTKSYTSVGSFDSESELDRIAVVPTPKDKAPDAEKKRRGLAIA